MRSAFTDSNTPHVGAGCEDEQWFHGKGVKVKDEFRWRRNSVDGREGRVVRAGDAEAVFAKADAHSKGLQLISQAMQRNPKSQEVRTLSVVSITLSPGSDAPTQEPTASLVKSMVHVNQRSTYDFSIPYLENLRERV